MHGSAGHPLFADDHGAGTHGHAAVLAVVAHLEKLPFTRPVVAREGIHEYGGAPARKQAADRRDEGEAENEDQGATGHEDSIDIPGTGLNGNARPADGKKACANSPHEARGVLNCC